MMRDTISRWTQSIFAGVFAAVFGLGSIIVTIMLVCAVADWFGGIVADKTAAELASKIDPHCFKVPEPDIPNGTAEPR